MPNHGHERLDVYWLSVELAGLCWETIPPPPSGLRHLRDQILRVATSVPLNIAEGGGEYSRADKARFYRMALRSTRECSAVLDILVRVRCVDPDSIIEIREVIDRVSAMLTRLVLAMRNRRVSS